MSVIFQCPACRALVGANEVLIPSDATRAALSCGACGAQAWLPAAPQSGARATTSAAAHEATAWPAQLPPPPAPPALPTQPAATALAVRAPDSLAAAFSAEQHARIVDRLMKLPPEGDAQSDLANDFTKLLGGWSDDGAHKALLKKASMMGQLAFVGQRYRAVLDAAPHDAASKKAQGDILSFAMAAMSTSRELGSVAEASNSRTTWMVVGVIALFIGAAALLLFVPRLLLPSEDEATMGQPADDGAAQR